MEQKETTYHGSNDLLKIVDNQHIYDNDYYRFSYPVELDDELLNFMAIDIIDYLINNKAIKDKGRANIICCNLILNIKDHKIKDLMSADYSKFRIKAFLSVQVIIESHTGKTTYHEIVYNVSRITFSNKIHQRILKIDDGSEQPMVVKMVENNDIKTIIVE